MISAENLTKGYGAQLLFDAASFKINQREKVGLVGRNGHGKSTLFRMIARLEESDAGSIIIPKNYRVGYVEQIIAFTESTVLDEGMTGLLPSEADQAWKVEKILFGLGFTEVDMHRPPGDFSGGFQVRLNLAKVLVSEPDMLLLDEPTNYLDISAIRWLSRFLKEWPRELILITHDRGFMDQVVTHTMGIHRKRVRKMQGDTGTYYDKIAEEEEIHEKTRLNDEKRRKDIELFITRFRAKARLGGLVQSRVKTLAKMEKKEKLEHIKDLEFSFRSAPFPAKTLMGVSGLSFGYEKGRPLFSGLDFSVNRGDRICVVGKNGKGKTTLIKVLAGAFCPTKGEIQPHASVKVGLFEQTNVSSLVDDRTVLEEIAATEPDITLQQARNICGAMMFEQDAANKKIGVLSGGEKSRVMLGKILATPVNLLILDEPTNHFDMESCDALLEALDDFDGTVIMVTHTEMFLHALADRLVVFQGDGAQVFEGTYQEFLEKRGWDEEAEPARQGAATPAIKLGKKELRKMRSQLVSERSKAVKPLSDRVEAVEKKIEAREEELSRLNEEMIDASTKGDGARISKLGPAIKACQREIEDLFVDLEDLTEQMEKKQARFDKRLAELESALE